MRRAIIAVDGASKGNPGPAGIGVVIGDESGKTVAEISEFIGEQTNNVAEYTALIRALDEALKLGFTDASVQTDSELMARQINGQYRVKNEGIVPLFRTVLELLGQFHTATITHVLRANNKRADSLASKAASSATESAQKPLLLEEPGVDDKKIIGQEDGKTWMLDNLATERLGDQETERVEDHGTGRPGDTGNVGAALSRMNVRTYKRSELIDITRMVKDAVKESGAQDGICFVFVPHTTAGITINENADPDVVIDILDTLNRLVPQSSSYRHVEGNADSHVKAGMMGFSVQIPVEEGRLVLGTWQGIYFCEFDGPRNRQFMVKVMGIQG
jgi:secondary thiamine-phosphate synthase enzyme